MSVCHSRVNSTGVRTTILKDVSLKPLTDVASKWSFLGAICPLQGVISSSGRYYSLCNVLQVIYLQWYSCNR